MSVEMSALLTATILGSALADVIVLGQTMNLAEGLLPSVDLEPRHIVVGERPADFSAKFIRVGE